jgi:uncharacterized protein
VSELAQRLRLLQRQAGRREQVGAPAAFDATAPLEAVCDVADGAGAGVASQHDTLASGANDEPERYAARGESSRHRQRSDTVPRTVAEARAQLAALTSRAPGRGRVAFAPPSPAAPASVSREASNRPPHAASGASTRPDVRRAAPSSATATARADPRSVSSLAPSAPVRDEVSNRPPDPTRTESKQGQLSPLDTLRRLLGVRPGGARPPRHFDRDLPGNEIAPGVRLHEHLLPWPRTPGTLDLDTFGHGHVDPARLHFFDTETTGLAGGTGTRAFMLGLGAWHAGVFRVRQLTLTTLGGETAMLEQFAAWLAPGALLVSYNGRSYDAPLLATRYRLARRPSPLPELPHLDLLHPTRRRYRGVWENCRLATIERELLGIVRDDDLPGSEAPRAWREWLAGGSARDLRRVGEHNRQDLVSLAQLLLRLAAAPMPIAG